MKYLSRIFFLSLSILFLAFSGISFATSVPFQNILLNPNNSVVAPYSFGPYFIIFCFTDNLETIGSVTWPFNGTTFSAPMPLTLVTNSNYQGRFADPAGTIVVTNTTGSQMVVSCLFAL